jgi:predicted transcriptional regulator
MVEYAQEVEIKMKRFFVNLSEKDKRHYAAVEAAKLGYGGIKYLAKLLGCTRQTIARGIKELECNTLVPKGKVRRLGGGRKSYQQEHPNIGDVFLKGY